MTAVPEEFRRLTPAALPSATGGLGDRRAGWRRFSILLSGYALLIACAALMDVRRMLAQALAAGAPGLDIGSIDFLTLAEWASIIALAARSDFSSLRTRRLELALGLTLAAVALIAVPPQSHRATVLFCLVLALRLGSVRGLRRLGACIALVGLQFAIGNRLFEPLNDVVIALDAWGAHALLRLGGYPSLVEGAVLRLPGSAHAVQIFAGCDTLRALAPVVCAFLVFTLCSHPATRARAVAVLVLVVAVVVLANWLRLGLMALSYDDYLYWHGGRGASWLSMAYALLAYLGSQAAKRTS